MSKRWRYSIVLCEDAKHDEEVERGFRTLQAPTWWANVGTIPRCPACACRHRKERVRQVSRLWEQRNRAKRNPVNRERQRKYRQNPTYRAAMNEERRDAYRLDDDGRMLSRLMVALRAWRRNPDYGARVVLGRTFTLAEAKREHNRLKQKRLAARVRIPGGVGPVARGLRRSGKV